MFKTTFYKEVLYIDNMGWTLNKPIRGFPCPIVSWISLSDGNLIKSYDHYHNRITISAKIISFARLRLGSRGVNYRSISSKFTFFNHSLE